MKNISVEISIGTVLLHAQPNVFMTEIEVGLDDPVMAVDAFTFTDECVRPQTPRLVFVEMPPRTTDEFFDQRRAADQPDSTRARVGLEKFPVGHRGDGDGFVHENGMAAAIPLRGW